MAPDLQTGPPVVSLVCSACSNQRELARFVVASGQVLAVDGRGRLRWQEHPYDPAVPGSFASFTVESSHRLRPPGREYPCRTRCDRGPAKPWRFDPERVRRAVLEATLARQDRLVAGRGLLR